MLASHQVVLAPGRDRSVRRRHPWLLASAIAHTSDAIPAGAEVRVLSSEGETLGFGLYAPASKLRVRLLAFGKERPAPDWIAQRIATAVARRADDPALAGTDALRLVNAEGETTEKGTWGKPSPWCDYSGTRDSVTEGIAIFQHPENRWFPSRWFTRDYGFFSPTPMQWLENDRLDLPKGEQLTLRYRVVVHTGNAATAGIADLWEQYRGAAAK